MRVLVCHCAAVNDRTIRDVIAAGAADEFDIAAACGAGSRCGGCVPAITELLGECAGCPVGDLHARPDLQPRPLFVDAGGWSALG